MKQSNIDLQEQEEAAVKIKDLIIQKIQENGCASLAELALVHERRHNILYHVRKLMQNNRIRVYIQIKQDSQSRSILDDEIYFKLANYDDPKDVLNLINEMCGNNSEIREQAKLKLVDLFVDRAKTTELARKRLEYKHYISEYHTSDGFEERWEDYLKGNKELTTRLNAEKISLFLMAGLNPEFKKKVAFYLTYKDKNGFYNTSFDCETG